MTDDDDNPLNLPWAKRTPQTRGRETEKRIMKKAGGRSHPNSGSGGIKWDGSTDDALVEIKEAGKTHAVGGRMLSDLLSAANAQGKDAYYVIQFPGIRLTGKITREDP